MSYPIVKIYTTTTLIWRKEEIGEIGEGRREREGRKWRRGKEMEGEEGNGSR